jgi:3-oxoacyl-[acyl-carrier protein] reductase
MITRVLALELGAHGIRVNAIAPGVTKTPMTEVMLGDPAVREALLKTIPLGRFGEARDVANAALFLASDESSYITGKTIPVDGDRYPG